LEKKYGELGRAAAERVRQWMQGGVPHAYPEIIAKHFEDERHLPLLFDAFWQVLPFGTGGRRGRVGYGPNRLNPTTVAMTVQGHCQYLRSAFPKAKDLVVVVANDVRVFNDLGGTYRFLGATHPLLGVSSRSLGRLACEIYAGNGLIAYFAEPEEPNAVLSTPELSFLIDRLKTEGGVNLSASHNPPDDNGIKVYDEFGSQPVAPQDQRLADAMLDATQIRSMPFEEALKKGLVRAIPAGLHEEYVDAYVKFYGNTWKARPDIPIVYTPLCGVGLTTVGDVLGRLGFPLLTPPDEGPDGSFAPIPFKAPNPEVPQATEPACAFADANHVDVVLSSDPDADRIGVEVKRSDGRWHHLDGNQISSVLCYFLMLDPQGPRRRGLVIETLVTTKIIARIVEKVGDSWLADDLLVGFKYVADVLKKLEREGRYKHITCSPSQLVLATEESHGAICIPTIRDKDATPACMYLAALYQRLRLEGRTLLDYYIQIIEELGGYTELNRSIVMAGAEGVMKKDRIMASLRESPPQTLGGQTVRKIVDYWDPKAFGPFVSETDKLPRNVIQIFTDAFIIAVRPSGTEPKLKFYCQMLPHGQPSRARGLALLKELKTRAEAVARQIYNELLARLDLSLSEAALLLPDIVDLDRKRDFDQKTVARLHEALAKTSFANLSELLAWLRGEVAAMTPGADPLPALKPAVAHLCKQWAAELGSRPRLAELQAWAGS